MNDRSQKEDKKDDGPSGSLSRESEVQDAGKSSQEETPIGESTGFSWLFADKSEKSKQKGEHLEHHPEERPPRKMIVAGSLIVAAAIVVVFAGIKAAQSIAGPFFLAIFLAVILTAPLRWLKSKGISDVGASLIICAAVLISGISIIWILSGSVNQFVARIPEYTVKFNKTLTTIDDFLEPYGLSLHGGPKENKHKPGSNNGSSFHPFLENPGQNDDSIPDSERRSEEIAVPVAEKSAISSSTDSGSMKEKEEKPDIKKDAPRSTLLGLFKGESSDENDPDGSHLERDFAEEPEHEEREEKEFLSPAFFGDHLTADEQAAIYTVGIVGYIRWAASELGKLAALSFIVMILVVFMMLETSRLPKKIAAVCGPRGITNEHLQKIVDKIWKYMLIKSIISFCVGFFVCILLIATGVEYALLWALIAFFLNFIPNIGSIIAAIPPVALALFDHGFATFAIVGIGYLVINQGLGYYVEPIFLGDGLGISPLVVLLSLIFWGWLLGMIGMFLSAPLTIVLKIVFDSFDETRWISILMDG